MGMIGRGEVTSEDKSVSGMADKGSCRKSIFFMTVFHGCLFAANVGASALRSHGLIPIGLPGYWPNRGAGEAPANCCWQRLL